MSDYDFTYDNGSLPGTKTDNPEQVVREASIPAEQKTTATELNQLSNASRSLRASLLASAPVFHVLRYGAVGDDANNDAPAIQAAYDAAAAAGGGILLIPKPANRYRMGRPLLAYSQNYVRIIGPGMDVPCLSTSDFAGPLIFACPDYDGLPLTTSKLVGGGLAADFRSATLGARSDRLRVDMKWGTGAKVNGWSAICWECMYTPEAPSVTNRSLTSGRTSILPSDGVHRAIEVMVDGTTGNVSAVLTIGGVVKVVTSDGFNLTMDGNTTYHIAVTYDGSTMRLFAAVKGTSSPVRGSVAATGPITQDVGEDLYFGSNPIAHDPRGILDFLYISNTARYTGTFTAPSVKLVSRDLNHKVMLNFNENPESSGRLVGALWMDGHGSGGIPAALPVESTEYSAQVTLAVEELQMVGSLATINAVGLRVEGCVFTGGEYGIFLDNNSYEARIRSVRTENAKRFSLRTRNAIGITSISDYLANGSTDYAIWLQNFSGTVDGLYTGSDKLPLIVDASGASGGIISLRGVVLTNEGHGSTPRAMAAFVEPACVKAETCVFQALNGITAPLVLVDHSASGKETPITFDTCAFDCDANASKIKFLNASPVKGSVIAINPGRSPFISPDSVPMSDPVDLVTIIKNGVVSNLSSVGVAASSGLALAVSGNATRGPMNWGSLSADPSSPVDGDTWHNSTDHKFRGRTNGVTVDFH